jgi:hypothetical protein
VVTDGLLAIILSMILSAIDGLGFEPPAGVERRILETILE